MHYVKPPKYTVKRRPKIRRRLALHTATIALAIGGGFLPGSFTYQGQAYTIDVTAKVAAPLPTEPAVITSPANQDRFSVPQITVSGTCPDDSYVKVFNGTALAGIANCSNNTFTTEVTLTPGANSLRAQVYNLTDDEGPASPAITVYYDPPVAPPEPSEPSPAPPAQRPGAPTTPGAGSPEPTPGVPGLQITLHNYRYQRLRPHDPWAWNVSVSGGTAPYRLHITWGDGTTHQLERGDSAAFDITHSYSTVGTYRPFIYVTDQHGAATSLHLLAEVTTNIPPLPQAQTTVSPWLLWSLYIGSALVIVQFWVWEINAWRKRHHRKTGAHRA